MATSRNQKILHTVEYHKHFDTESYLASYAFFEVIPSFDILIRELVRVLMTNRSKINHSKVLEFGGGPTLMSSFALALYADSIRFVDYTPSNLEAVKNWINQTPEAHDWSSLFDAILDECRRQSDDPTSIPNRTQSEDKLRTALKAGDLSPSADVNSNDFCPALDGEPKESYDVVLSALCLEDACLTMDTFQTTIKRLGNLLKPNGLLILSHGRNQSFYCVNECRFFALPIDEESLRATLNSTGFGEINIISIPKPPDAHADADGFLIATACKKG